VVQGADPRLLPDLSASLDLNLGSQRGVLVVSRQSLAFNSGRAYVWTQDSGSFEKREVKIAASNDLEAVIGSGLAEGDIIRRVANDGAEARQP
jgi:multidrug efflux pump subunit AcrA (membrane-fusion protein)